MVKAARKPHSPNGLVAFSKILPDSRNANRGTKRGAALIKKSLKEYGAGRSILLDKNNRMIAGNKTLAQAAAGKTGIKGVRIIETDGSELIAVKRIDLDLQKDGKAKSLAIADNRAGELSLDWDPEILKALDAEIDLSGMFSGEELAALLGTQKPLLTDEDDVPPVPKKPVTKLGDMYLLGAHRLVCGDSTKAEDVERLMDDQKADMVFTDPPYGISVVRKGTIGSKPFGKNGFDSVVKAGVYAPIIGDESITTAIAAYELCSGLGIKTILFWGGNFYAHALPPTSCWVVWDKETDGNFGDGEIAWCSAKKSIRIFRHKWSGMVKASERSEKRVHPTQKPVALASWAVEEFGAHVVLDLFGGSGSTLIACEKSGRKCFMMELAPAYCDVIVARWEAATGEKAKKVASA
jgi:DNA modification methylase